MKYVYLLMHDFNVYEGTKKVIGVFPSKRKAKRALEKYNKIIDLKRYEETYIEKIKYNEII